MLRSSEIWNVKVHAFQYVNDYAIVSIYLCHTAELGQMNQSVFMNENDVLSKAEGYVIDVK